MENQETAQMPGQDVSSTPAPELTIADLQNLRAIVDTASRRGAFSAAEMSSVGSVFDRLNTFLNVAAPTPAANPETPAA